MRLNGNNLHFFLPKHLHIWKKCCTFAVAFDRSIRKVVWVVERATLEMWCTHYVVPGVRIPHFPQRKRCDTSVWVYSSKQIASFLWTRCQRQLVGITQKSLTFRKIIVTIIHNQSVAVKVADWFLCPWGSHGERTHNLNKPFPKFLNCDCPHPNRLQPPLLWYFWYGDTCLLAPLFAHSYQNSILFWLQHLLLDTKWCNL